jgi:hypothetical protein
MSLADIESVPMPYRLAMLHHLRCQYARRRLDMREDMAAARDMKAAKASNIQLSEIAYDDDLEAMGMAWNAYSQK